MRWKKCAFPSKIAIWVQKRKTPTFSKLKNFGPHILTPWESTRAGLQDARNLWAEVHKWLRYGEGSEKWKTHTFSKLTHAPSKSLWCICPKFCHWPALDASYKWPKFGAHSGCSFLARQKSGLSKCKVNACKNSSSSK